jgi:hypothetical protein
MKHFLLSAIVLGIVGCNSQAPNPKDPKTGPTGQEQLDKIANDTASRTTVQWLDSAQNFGKVVEGEKVTILFNFKNTGTNPLIIEDVSASCGCTIPEKPEAPIAPGEKGVIKAEFNSEKRVGPASKDLIVTCNTAAGTHTLHFEGEVLEKK